MKRDMDIVRNLLLEIEEKDLCDGQWIQLTKVDLHVTDLLFKLEKAGYIEGYDDSTNDERSFRPIRLTWQGDDFVDSIRDPETWRKTKEGALAAGGWTVELLKDLAKGIIRNQIENLSGIKL